MHLPLRYPLLAGVVSSAFLLAQGALPTIGEEAHQTACLSRMRELATAIRNYAADHNDELPLAADRSKHPWKWWYDSIFPYTASVSSFYCPLLLEQQRSPMRSPLLPVTWNLNYLSYGMTHPTDEYQRKHGHLRFADVTDPGKKIMLGESNFAILRNTSQYWKQDLAPRHAGRANFITFSGEAFSAGDLPGRVPSSLGSGVHDRACWTLP